ncbi:MAG: hypothetical protein II883_02285 [Spirochaetales bacterium]|nr:hypothetical protein [Spirochaetales bacterium]
MRKLKITVAILVVLFACQAVFAAFVPVQKADPAVTDQLARYCDILQVLGQTQKDPVGFYKEMAAGPDEALGLIIALYALPQSGYESVTTMDDLAKVFPRGVEPTDEINAFKRAAIHLAAYTARNGRLNDTALIQEAKASFEIVGYKFMVTLEDNTIKFDFIDIYSEDELKMIGAMLSLAVTDAGDVTFPEYGEIDIATKGVTSFGFDYFVAYARSLMYSSIYN